MRDLENGLRAVLREAGLKLGTPTRKEFAARVRELTAADPVLSVLAEPLLTIIAAMTRELAQLTKRVLEPHTGVGGHRIEHEEADEARGMLCDGNSNRRLIAGNAGDEGAPG